MKLERVNSFDELKHGQKIISAIDNEVSEFYIDKDGDKYIGGTKSLFPIFQFEANDFYIYTGSKEIGEIDAEYFQN